MSVIIYLMIHGAEALCQLHNTFGVFFTEPQTLGLFWSWCKISDFDSRGLALIPDQICCTIKTVSSANP